MIDLAMMTAAARELIAAEEATAAAEQVLKEKKEAERKLREETIPALFQELGLEELRLEDGSRFTVKQEVYCEIPATRREEAFAWLEGQGHGGLIKTVVGVQFGKGELEEAKQLVADIQEAYKLTAELKRAVHPQTLKAWVKEQLLKKAEELPDFDSPGAPAEEDSARPEPLPLDLFGARPVMTAEVKIPKPKKPLTPVSDALAPPNTRGRVHEA